MDIYKSRWENAKRIAEKINSFLDVGCLVFDENGNQISRKFEIKESWPGSGIEEIVNGCCFYFINSKTLDNGLYTTIEEYNSKFKKWKIVRPEHIISLI